MIELVVVMTIIAVMALISIPSYLRYIERASLAEAVSVLNEYKTALAVMWSTQSKLPTTGDVLVSSPADLPFGTLITSNLPDTIESIILTSSGNGCVIRVIIKAEVFSAYPSNNRQLALGCKPLGNELSFECGNLSANPATATDIGFIDKSILPRGCNYNGIATWLST